MPSSSICTSLGALSMGSPKLNSRSTFSAPIASDLPSSVAWTNTAPSPVPNSRTSEFSVGSTKLASVSPAAAKASDRSSCVVTWLGSEGSARLADDAATETAQAMAIADRSRERVRRNKVLFIFFFPMRQVNTGCMVVACLGISSDFAFKSDANASRAALRTRDCPKVPTQPSMSRYNK